MVLPNSSPNDFLTPEESAQVDQALLTSRERFSARVAIYSLRVLKQISQQTGQAIAHISDQALADWVAQDTVAAQVSAQGLDTDDSFKQFFIRLVQSSRKPLGQISQASGLPIESLTPAQVIAWFEAEAKRRIEQN
ncbi:MAG: hypothetical protein VKK04_22430 [Synechococcales bacterium]|nr:hypothetical protein [Synechococcales bacterium]